MTARPAAGPLTPSEDPLREPTIRPPMTPAIKPAIGGAPEASAIPRHSGRATRKTTIDAGMSQLKLDFIAKNGDRVRLALVSELRPIIVYEQNCIRSLRQVDKGGMSDEVQFSMYLPRPSCTPNFYQPW